MGKAALGFWPDRIGTLVSMATDSSHRVIMGKLVSTLASSFLIVSSSYYYAGNEDNHNIPYEFEFRPDSTKDCGVSCL